MLAGAAAITNTLKKRKNQARSKGYAHARGQFSILAAADADF